MNELGYNIAQYEGEEFLKRVKETNEPNTLVELLGSDNLITAPIIPKNEGKKAYSDLCTGLSNGNLTGVRHQYKEVKTYGYPFRHFERNDLIGKSPELKVANFSNGQLGSLNLIPHPMHMCTLRFGGSVPIKNVRDMVVPIWEYLMYMDTGFYILGQKSDELNLFTYNPQGIDLNDKRFGYVYPDDD